MRRFFVISGPSGVGKTTLAREVVKLDPGLRLSVSCTTRSRRSGEKNGKHYRFVGLSSFLAMVDNHDFIEWAIVHGNYYGTPKRELLVDDRHVILEIDFQGARQIQEKFRNASTIFVIPKTFDVLEKRIRERKSGEPEEEIERRLQTARLELGKAGDFDHRIVNDNLERTTREILDTIHKINQGIL